MGDKKPKTLADVLGAGDSQKKRGVEFQSMQSILSGDRAWKIQIEGEFKCGKTRFCLSVLDYLHRVRGMKPEEVLMVYIDLDNGVIPLISQGLVDEELHERILYYLCNDFGEVLESTDEALRLLQKHKDKYGQASAWLIIDNMGMAWEGTRDYYSESVYGVKMNELLITAKRKALEKAHAKGKDSGRIPAQEFDRMTDYSIINPLHNNWAEKIKNSNINFIWTALLKYEEKEVKGNQRTVEIKPEGQKHNSARVDFIVRKKRDKELYLTDLIGSRFTSNLFVNERDMDFPEFAKKIDDMMTLEKKLRDKKVKRKISEDSTVSKKENKKETNEIIKEPQKEEEEQENIDDMKEESIEGETEEAIVEEVDDTEKKPIDDDW